MTNTSVLAKRKVHKSKGAYVIPENDLMKMTDKVEKDYKGGKTKKLTSFTDLIDQKVVPGQLLLRFVSMLNFEPMEIKYVKIAVYVPASHGDKVRKALAEGGAGHIGNYDCCSFTVKGTGRFRAGKGSRPFVGRVEKIEKVEEERIETICPRNNLKNILKAVKAVHPYDEPAIDIYPLLNADQL